MRVGHGVMNPCLPSLNQALVFGHNLTWHCRRNVTAWNLVLNDAFVEMTEIIIGIHQVIKKEEREYWKNTVNLLC